MRADRPSLTASLVAAVRALYAEMPEPLRIAPDASAADLVGLPLGLPARVVRAAPLLGGAIHHGLGYALGGVTWHVALRTAAIDDALRAALRRGATQVVLLGAGLDNRAHRLPELGDVNVFEVDHPSTQRYKEARLENAHAGRSPATFVPVDFERDRLEEALPHAGFAAASPSFWIWEGVTVYLTPDAIAATLGAVAALSAPGSRIAATYSRRGGLGNRLRKLLEPTAAVIGEPVRGMRTPEQMAEHLTREGFAIVSDESAADWSERYWPDRPPDVREWERLVVAERRDAEAGRAA